MNKHKNQYTYRRQVIEQTDTQKIAILRGSRNQELSWLSEK